MKHESDFCPLVAKTAGWAILFEDLFFSFNLVSTSFTFSKASFKSPESTTPVIESCNPIFVGRHTVCPDTFRYLIKILHK